ncbi:hypothetical protein RKD18_000955 [Streptomyces phaeoluteigriseus]
MGTVDEDLPGGQGHQWHRARLFEGEGGGLRRDVVHVDRDELREVSDPQVARTGVDLVADVETAHGGADLRHDTGHVVPEHERTPVLQKLLELPVADHLVQRVDTGGAHPDQDVAVPEGGFGHLCHTCAVLAVLLDDECLHAWRPFCGEFR